MAEKSRQSYAIQVAEDFSRVLLRGYLRLQKRPDYQKVLDTLREAAQRSPGSLEIDVRELRFLNSPGITALAGFLRGMRDIGKKIVITGSKTFAWQSKTLDSFSRLFDNVIVNLR